MGWWWKVRTQFPEADSSFALMCQAMVPKGMSVRARFAGASVTLNAIEIPSM